MEVSLKPNEGRFHLIKDFAAKAAEHVARLAAIFEYFSEGLLTISKNSVQRAIRVVTWYLFEFDRLFGAMHIENATAKNADALLQWLRRKSAFLVQGERPRFSRRQIMQFGPKATRSSEFLDPAIDHLINSESVSWFDYFRKVIVINMGHNINPKSAMPPHGDIFSMNAGLVHSDSSGIIFR